PKYEALSYAWGNEDANESIIIDGKSLAIRSNLAAALRQRIWIDAICINQADVDERNQ
ncbi:hypothetical protein BKA61DRAFT_488615, partial [Leptodontidium sp. MPI-SDFR-AT-0119]